MNKEVTIKDQVWFADKGELGAVELHTLSNVKKNYSKAEWDKKRFGMLCTTPAVFGQNKETLEILCAFYGYCKYEEVKQLIDTMEYLRRAGKAPMSRIKEVNNPSLFYTEEPVTE